MKAYYKGEQSKGSNIYMPVCCEWSSISWPETRGAQHLCPPLESGARFPTGNGVHYPNDFISSSTFVQPAHSWSLVTSLNALEPRIFLLTLCSRALARLLRFTHSRSVCESLQEESTYLHDTSARPLGIRVIKWYLAIKKYQPISSCHNAHYLNTTPNQRRRQCLAITLCFDDTGSIWVNLSLLQKYISLIHIFCQRLWFPFWFASLTEPNDGDWAKGSSNLLKVYSDIFLTRSDFWVYIDFFWRKVDWFTLAERRPRVELSHLVGDLYLPVEVWLR